MNQPGFERTTSRSQSERCVIESSSWCMQRVSFLYGVHTFLPAIIRIFNKSLSISNSTLYFWATESWPGIKLTRRTLHYWTTEFVRATSVSTINFVCIYLLCITSFIKVMLKSHSKVFHLYPDDTGYLWISEILTFAVRSGKYTGRVL